MIKELKALGASTVLLDGVQFPKRTSGASFGNTEYASQSKAEVLATFIASANTAMDGGRVILSAPGLAALGTDTTVYGGNPVTFGAGGVAPGSHARHPGIVPDRRGRAGGSSRVPPL